jgi:hypothetical protein
MPDYLKLFLLLLMTVMSICHLFLLWVWMHYGKQLHQGRPPLNNFVMTAGTLLMTAALFSNLRETPLHYALHTVVFFISGIVLTIGGGWGAFQQARRGDWRNTLRTLTTRIK